MQAAVASPKLARRNSRARRPAFGVQRLLGSNLRLVVGAACLFAGIAAALWAQHGIAHGLKANDALTRYGFAIALFLAGVSQAADVPLVGGGGAKVRRGGAQGRTRSPVALLIDSVNPAKL